MPTPQKEQSVQDFQKEAKEAVALIVTTFKALKTTEFNEMRAKLRPLKSEYRVVKNSLTKIAFKNAGMEDLSKMVSGPSAVVIERGDAIAATKAVFEFAKSHENLQINGGFFDGKVVTTAQLKTIASLPSREVLLAQFLGTLQAPVANLVGAMQAPVQQLLSVLDQLSKKAPESK